MINKTKPIGVETIPIKKTSYVNEVSVVYTMDRIRSSENEYHR